MRRRKEQRNDEDESAGSEVADEPDEFQDSGEDWTPAADSPAVAPTRGGAGRLKRGPKGGPKQNSVKKAKKASSSEDSENDPDNENDEENDQENDNEDEESDSSQQKDVPKYFHSGNYVLLKSDVKWDGDNVVSQLKDLFLWKIDGKALLQKFVPAENDGKIIHKCTCVYSGWSADNRENYYPITEILEKNLKTDCKEQCVALNLGDLIKVRDKR